MRMTITRPARAIGRAAAAAVACALCACASPKERALERVAVVGASLSAGFALDVEAGRPLGLSDVLECALTTSHEPVASAADVFFFMRPRETGALLAEKAAEAEPTLLVALDFLFWFGYGVVDDEEDRLARLEDGLRLLERFSCPAIVGDLPDMSEAIGLMLSAAQVPAPETRARMNRRIREWAAAREAVVVPLSELVGKLRAGGEVRSGSRVYSGAASRALLQRDRLHPTVEGLACVAVAALEAFAGEDGAGYLDDPKTVADRVRGERG